MKYSLAAALSGVLIALMIYVNGLLTSAVGNYHATVYIHVSGLLLAALFLLVGRQSLHPAGRLPIHLYLGGVIGVLTVVFSNVAVPAVGVTITLALGLLGQLICSLAIDKFGLLGAKVQQLRPYRLVSAALVLLGIVIMMLDGRAA